MPRNRKFLEFENVGTEWVELPAESVPQKFELKRVRAEITDGSGVSLALSIREKSNPSSLLDIALEYSLTANPIDSGEDQVVWADRPSSSRTKGTVYVAVKCNSLGNSVRVRLEYEGE